MLPWSRTSSSRSKLGILSAGAITVVAPRYAGTARALTRPPAWKRGMGQNSRPQFRSMTPTQVDSLPSDGGNKWERSQSPIVLCGQRIAFGRPLELDVWSTT